MPRACRQGSRRSSAAIINGINSIISAYQHLITSINSINSYCSRARIAGSSAREACYCAAWLQEKTENITEIKRATAYGMLYPNKRALRWPSCIFGAHTSSGWRQRGGSGAWRAVVEHQALHQLSVRTQSVAHGHCLRAVNAPASQRTRHTVNARASRSTHASAGQRALLLLGAMLTERRVLAARRARDGFTGLSEEGPPA